MRLVIRGGMRGLLRGIVLFLDPSSVYIGVLLVNIHWPVYLRYVPFSVCMSCFNKKFLKLEDICFQEDGTDILFLTPPTKFN